MPELPSPNWIDISLKAVTALVAMWGGGLSTWLWLEKRKEEMPLFGLRLEKKRTRQTFT